MSNRKGKIGPWFDKRHLGRKADITYSEVRAALTVALDIAIKNQESVPSTDLWSDSSMELFALIELLISHANTLKTISLEGEAALMKEVYDSLQTKH
jgi:hypothetical protein|tara:strand:- start:911 stop:1201 length:291 start_codon:yes stop_codon:yes gene_type:complete